jgi:hypothetical protein
MRRILPSTVFALMLLWGTAMAQVPDNMHIQGNIAATAGEPLEGAHDLRFEIYDNNTGGNLLWSETHTDVAFANGYYSATLGAQGSPMTFSALAFSQSLWLEITIDGSDVLAPRTPLLASAYSMTARSVFGVSNIFPAEGNAAVGSTTPGVEPGAGKYFTISAAPSGIPNNYASLELQGGQGFIGDPIGRIDFISNSAPGNSAITRIQSNTTGSSQWKGDLLFFTKNGSDFSSALLEERMRITHEGNVGIGVSDPDAALDVAGAAIVDDLEFRDHPGKSLKPIGFGNIAATGTINAASSSANFTCSKTNTGIYDIDWTGAENSHFQAAIVSVTPIGSDYRTATWSSTGGGAILKIYIFDSSGNPVDANFTFIVYRP